MSDVYYLFASLLLLSCYSCVWLLATTWTAAYQGPPSIGFSRQEYWNGVPLPSPFASLHSLKCFHFSFHCLALLRSTSYIPTAFTLASGHPGLEIKILFYYCTVYRTISKVQRTCRGCMQWQCTPDAWANVTRRVRAHLHLWKFTTWIFICRGAYCICWIHR